MGELITGNLYLDDKTDGTSCFFNYNKKTEMLDIYLPPQACVTRTASLIGRKYNAQPDNKILFELRAPLDAKYGECMKSLGVEYYVEDYYEHSTYTKMELQFSELNCFVPPVKRVKVSKESIEFSISPAIHPFTFSYREKNIEVSFCTKYRSVKTPGLDAAKLPFSVMILSFPPTSDFDFLRGLYNVVRNFFSFICNRQNIGMHYAVLIGEHPNINVGGKIIEGKAVSQKIFFSRQDFEPPESNQEINKTPRYDLFKSRISNLFGLFSNSPSNDGPFVSINGIHRSTKSRHLIDLSQAVSTVAAFEHYKKKTFPANDKRWLSGEINRLYNGTENWPPLKPILSDCLKKLDNTEGAIDNVAKKVADWRNELAHENRVISPDELTVNSLRFIEYINYCIVLRKAGYTDKQIKAIITSIFPCIDVPYSAISKASPV